MLTKNTHYKELLNQDMLGSNFMVGVFILPELVTSETWVRFLEFMKSFPESNLKAVYNDLIQDQYDCVDLPSYDHILLRIS